MIGTSLREVYIVAAKRTAVGSFMGSLSTIPASELGAMVIRAILNENSLKPEIVDEVIMGQVLTGGSGQNPARQALIKAGMSINTPAYTVNKVCGSGLKAVHLAACSVMTGAAELVIAGGQENMSLGLHGGYIRGGQKFGEVKFRDFMMYDGLTDAFSGSAMGVTAENIAREFGITREDQDQFALRSQQKAAAARNSGKFKDEILPIEVEIKKERKIFDYDESIRADTSLEGLSRLRPAFDQEGTVTAGNASTINDGAAAVLLCSASAMRNLGLTPIAKIVSFAAVGVDPQIMGTGPVPASNKAMALAGWTINDLELIEANEAFAAQAHYVNTKMNWDVDKVNVNGGSIAIGHPIGASGARILVTLLHEMRRRKTRKALATLCVGGGMGVAMCLEGAQQ